MEENKLNEKEQKQKEKQKEFQLSGNNVEYLSDAAGWARSLARFYAIIFLLYILAGIFSPLGGNVNYAAAFTSVIILIIVGYFLYGFGSKAKKAILNDDAEMMSKSLKLLRNLFMVQVILLVILLLSLIVFVFFGGYN